MRTWLILAFALPSMLRAQVPRAAVVGSPRATVTTVAATGNPTGFAATVQRRDVVLSWQPVPGVSQFLIGGPEMGSTGQKVEGTTYTVPLVGPGSHEWTVASLGADQAPLTNWANWPKAQAVVDTSLYAITFVPWSLGGQMGGDGPVISMTANRVNIVAKGAMSLNHGSRLHLVSGSLPNGRYNLRLDLANIPSGDSVGVIMVIPIHHGGFGQFGRCSLTPGNPTCVGQTQVTTNHLDLSVDFYMGSVMTPMLASVSVAGVP
jgi:hypothetical protein